MLERIRSKALRGEGASHASLRSQEDEKGYYRSLIHHLDICAVYAVEKINLLKLYQSSASLSFLSPARLIFVSMKLLRIRS